MVNGGAFQLDAAEGVRRTAGVVREKQAHELLVAARVFALQLYPRRAAAVVFHYRRRPFGQQPGRHGFAAGAEGVVVRGAGAGRRHDDGAAAFRVAQGEVERDIPAHGQAADVRLLQAQVVHQTAQVFDGDVLRVRLRVGGHVRRRIAPVVVGDDPVAVAEVAHLLLPAFVGAGEFVAPDERKALAGGLVKDVHSVGIEGRH